MEIRTHGLTAVSIGKILEGISKLTFWDYGIFGPKGGRKRKPSFRIDYEYYYNRTTILFINMNEELFRKVAEILIRNGVNYTIREK
ncbi:hypothetical protein COV24_00490 [candidate division WWE3 bacterium CG10_big_fil_rev_8_21_14_0_10_32_10]|uniref:Uncharacterized protein n=1 Tax=candidate division WWE3 bacterium CG10_big_fil_rev_8_21_14_0_10_32_10 TaxID=1975090 RepID=A0A2H0RBL8_UNCKA|nr:MAG: hypothetical protein COV24_00490 [candidate division WWE3 bacterium CG10_big_fil_rev_8_21_14_0_10_32_10]